jgi:hypothetical protein
MHHQRNQAAQDTDDLPHGIGRCIRPRTTVRDTVLAAHMHDEGLFVHGWRDGPSSWSDAPALWRELVAALHAMQIVRCSSPGDGL